MLIIKRYLSYYGGILTVVFLEIFINFPGWLLPISISYITLFFLGLWYLQRTKLTNIKKRIAYFILPLIFIINVVSFFVFFNFEKIFLHSLAFLVGVIVWLYLESFFLKHYFVNFFSRRSLENTVENIIIITAFLFFINFFSFRVYFNWSYVKLFILAGLILYLLNWIQLVFNNILVKRESQSHLKLLIIRLKDKVFSSHFSKFNKILLLKESKSKKYANVSSKTLIFLILVPALSLEILLVSIFLPTNFYSIALLNTIFLYILMLFSRYHLLEQFSLKMVQKYLSLGIILLLVTFLFSNWT